MRTLTFIAVLAVATSAHAKGLNELSQGNPESEAAEGEATAEGEAAATATPMEKSEASKAIADKLSLATSFGWVKASKSEGKYSGGGMSDVTVGYKFANNLFGTYRYAPVAVSGVEDDQSYRGVWETHFFGARMNFAINPKLTAFATGEAGYAMVHLNPTDGQEQVAKHEQSGGQAALGGGADFQIMDKVSAGPKLVLGFGSFTTIQVAGAVGFLF